MTTGAPDRDWLPRGKRAAVVWTIDDIHPARSTDYYEAGGDLGRGALGHVEWLLRRHPQLRVTLFTTADWREISALPTRRLLARVPWLRERLYLAPTWPKGTMALDRHPEFVAYLKGLPRTEIALHGLHHTHKGSSIPVEFQEQDPDTCEAMLREALGIFDRAGLDVAKGMTPPGWNLPDGLAVAMERLGFRYVASARDLFTPISPDALTDMSGLRGVPLIRPYAIRDGKMVHIPSNFQATSDPARALAIIEASGLLAVKAHIVKVAMGHTQLDGMDLLYRNYLDLLFGTLAERYGDALWWTTMGEIADLVLDRANAESSV